MADFRLSVGKPLSRGKGQSANRQSRLQHPRLPHGRAHRPDEGLPAGRRFGVGRDILRDLGGSVGNRDLGTVEKVSVCGAGDVGAISLDDEVVLLDLSDSKVILRVNGSCGSVSPDGARLAYIDSGRKLMLRSVKGADVESLNVDHVAGLGAWSPDARYLLASAFPAGSYWKRLMAVETLGGGVCELARLREGNDGSRSAWISRGLAAS